MLTALFDVEGLVHHEIVPRGHSMNHSVYKTVLQLLQDAFHQKLPCKLFPVPGFFTSKIHPAALSVRVFGPAVVSHVPYQIWPTVTSSCFPGWRSPWKGKYFMKSQRSNWIQHGSCRPFHRRYTTDTMKSGRIAGITLYNLEDLNVEKIIQGDLKCTLTTSCL